NQPQVGLDQPTARLIAQRNLTLQRNSLGPRPVAKALEPLTSLTATVDLLRQHDLIGRGQERNLADLTQIELDRILHRLGRLRLLRFVEQSLSSCVIPGGVDLIGGAIVLEGVGLGCTIKPIHSYRSVKVSGAEAITHVWSRRGARLVGIGSTKHE